MTDLSEHYILATGRKDVKRLRLLHEVYGPGTETLFHRVGLRDGQRVVEIGCGSGNIACWVAHRFFALNAALGERRGENFCLGASLPRLFREAGFARPEVGANFALALRGEQKRLLGMTFAEFAPELVSEGLASQEEVDRVAADLITLADEETTLFGFPLVVQVWAVR
jgi:hypothetical protein